MLLAFFGMALTLPLPVPALAQEHVARIGLLRTNSPPDPFVEAFRDGMRALGYQDGRSVTYEIRWADGRPEALPSLAAELAALGVDVIVTGGETAIHAAKQAAPTIPIVMGASNDPVAAGFAQSLRRPGGMITGLTIISQELTQKRLELFREALPNLSRVAVLVNPSFPAASAEVQAIETAARLLGLTIKPVSASHVEEFDGVFSELKDGGFDGLISLADPFFTAHRWRLARIAHEAQVPSMFYWREFVEAGGLLSYGPENTELYRRAATYVDRILKGAKPGDLSIEQPTRFVLAVNVATARRLGLTIPQSILLRADEVIE
jgi:putative ABC transport system substrate-binding protein